jgi:hypothetical protein
MPLQNRMPFWDIVASAHHGMLMGNRGCCTMLIGATFCSIKVFNLSPHRLVDLVAGQPDRIHLL